MAYKSKYGYEKQQTQINRRDMASAYQKKVAYNMFYSSVKWLEKYIEVAHADHYSDWEDKKQFYDDGIKRKDITTPERASERLSNSLYMLADDYPLEFREEWKKEFYEWIDATEIDANDCPEKLKHFLYGFHEILEGREEKIKEAADNRKEIMDVNSPEYAEALNRVFANMQNPLQSQREEESSLRGKSHEDMKIKKQVKGGNEKNGEKIFRKIAKQVAHGHNGFEYFPRIADQERIQQVPTNQGRILSDKIKQNLHEWKLKEVVVFKGYYGDYGQKKEWALVHKDVNLKKYNWQGYLEVDSRMIYFKKDHRLEEWVQIERYYSEQVGVSGQIRSNNSPHTINFAGVVQEVKNNPQIWRVDEVITEYNNRGEEIKREQALIHNSVEVGFDGAVGDWDQPIYLLRKFSSEELAEINQVLGISQSFDNRSNLIEDIKRNIHEFEFRRVITKWAKDGKGKEENETMLVHKSVQLSENDYNELGELIVKNDKMFQENRFNQEEWIKIRRALERNQIIERIRQDKNAWITANIRGIGKALINRSSIEGTNIKQGGEFYGQSHFSDEEWAKIELICSSRNQQSQKQENTLQSFSIKSNPSRTGLITTLTVGGFLLVGSGIMVTKKVLSKKKQSEILTPKRDLV